MSVEITWELERGHLHSRVQSASAGFLLTSTIFLNPPSSYSFFNLPPLVFSLHWGKENREMADFQVTRYSWHGTGYHGDCPLIAYGHWQDVSCASCSEDCVCACVWVVDCMCNLCWRKCVRACMNDVPEQAACICKVQYVYLKKKNHPWRGLGPQPDCVRKLMMPDGMSKCADSPFTMCQWF